MRYRGAMSLRSLSTSAAVFAAALLCAVWFGGVAQARPKATPTPAPTPTPVADPAVTKLVIQQFVDWQAGTVNKSMYVAGVQSKLSDDKVNEVSRKLGLLGALTNTVYIGPLLVTDMPPDAHGYIYQMQCREGNVYLWLIINGQGKIATIFFKDKLTTEEVELPATPGPSASP